MKLNKIHVTCSQIFSQFFCAYLTLTLVGLNEFGHPICASAAVVVTPTPAASPPYVRKSREASPTSAPEGMDGQDQYLGSASSAGSGFYPFPSFKHKYPPRMTRFHGDTYPPSAHRHNIRSMTSFPKLNPLAGILGGRSSEISAGRQPTVEDLFEGESQDPTFTPFISARALSNIPQFFQHLRDNLEALQMDEEEEGSEEGDLAHNERLLGQLDGLRMFGNDDEAGVPNIPRPIDKPMRWMPMTAGMTGRSHIRHFVHDPAESELFYRKPANSNNPVRNAYEFGLG